MARAVSLLLLLSIFYIAGTSSAYSRPSSSYIQKSCKATTFPAVCLQTLSAYSSKIQQSPQNLALTALSVSLSRAQYAKGFVSKMTKFKGLKRREYQAIKDCVEEMDDTVDRLSKAAQELQRLSGFRGDEFLFHMSNVQTYVSAALTDENTCFDGFAGRALNGKLKSSIRAQVVKVSQVTSNALALVNQLAATH
ncbi:21 kDa protein [Carica papaya]|uniref:Pectinesterase inhibitor domain-containing protein n=1 Tax=Carica papaya TaxID=3649 RepID=A6YGF1_CARPA|nr:21 kDa protein [Carica papaya]ABS01356.1 unknown [Carica papaya]